MTLSGTKKADHSVVIPAVDGGDPLCTIGATESQTWTCSAVTLPSGTIGLKALEYDGSTHTATSAALTLRVLGAPAFTSTGDIINGGSLDGLGWDGANVRIRVSAPSASIQTCGQQVGDGYWYCGLTLPSGTYRVQVEQSWPGSSTEWSPPSPARTLTIDRDVPRAPIITTPRDGDRITQQPSDYRGTGENLATVDVYVSGTPICTTTVKDKKWACTGTGIRAGNHEITAIQWDAAQNFSSPSAAVEVRFGKITGSATPPPSTTPPSSAPSAPQPGPTASDPVPAPPPSPTANPAIPVDPTEPTPAPAIPTPESTDPPVAAPLLPPPPGANLIVSPQKSWGTPTLYGAAIVSPQQAFSDGHWGLGLLLAAGWLILIALPFRLLAGALRGRFHVHGPNLTGRNRHYVAPVEKSSPLTSASAHPLFIATGAVVGAALLAVLASGIQSEFRYLRLTIAVTIGLTVLNLAVAVATRGASKHLGIRCDIRLVPIFLGIGALTAILSRIGGIQPPLIVGVVVAAQFAMSVSARSRGIAQTTQIAVISTLAVVAWVTLGLLPAVDGFWMTALNEMLSAICLAGIGSSLLLLLPVVNLPGRAILEWSPIVWLALTLAVGVLAGMILAGANFPILFAAAGAAVIAVGCAATWSWVRFVEPATS